MPSDFNQYSYGSKDAFEMGYNFGGMASGVVPQTSGGYQAGTGGGANNPFTQFQMPTKNQGQIDLLNKFLSGGIKAPSVHIPKPTAYTGEMNAAPSHLESMSLKGLEQMTNALMAGKITERVDREPMRKVEAMLDEIMGRGPQDINQYYDQAIQKPLLEAFGKTIMPAISRSYAPSGFWSSQRTTAEDTARENLVDALATERARVGYQAYRDDTQAKLGAGSQMLQIPAMEANILQAERGIDSSFVNDLAKTFAAGSAETARMQGDLDRLYREFVRVDQGGISSAAQEASLNMQGAGMYQQGLLGALNMNPFENFVVVPPPPTIEYGNDTDWGSIVGNGINAAGKIADLAGWFD